MQEYKSKSPSQDRAGHTGSETLIDSSSNPDAGLILQAVSGPGKPIQRRYSPTEILALQKTLGNRAVSRILAQYKQTPALSKTTLQRSLNGPQNSTAALAGVVQRGKRGRSDFETPQQAEAKNTRPNKRQKLDEPQQDDESDADIDMMDEEINDLAERFARLSISFHSALDNKDHAIYPNENLDDVIIHSDPTPLNSIITLKKWLGIRLTDPEVAQLQTHQTEIQDALDKLKKSASAPNNKALRKAMSKTAKFLQKKGTIPVPQTDLTDSEYHTVTTPDVVGKRLVADPLSSRSKIAGSTAVDGDLMTAYRSRISAINGNTKNAVQAHLLNMKTWGPGQLWNLTPASKQFNSDMESTIETPLKKAVIDKHLVIYFEAEVSYHNHPLGTDYTTDPEKYLFSSIKFKAHQLHEDVTQKDFIQVSTIPDDPLVTQLNKTMPWNQGNLPRLTPMPSIRTETDPEKFTKLGWPASAAEALTSLNKAGIAGVLTRSKWSANTAFDTMIGTLNGWLKDKRYPTFKGKSKPQKRVVWTTPPVGWKKQVDWS